jgi:acyl-coenzyme A synthetase/AMP-(fatty) acid ligase/acyl carrier protein
MNDVPRHITDLPPEQRAIRAKCFHPSGDFVEFKKEEIEQSIPERFEKIVRVFPDHMAVKSKNQTLTYGQLNKAANQVANAVLARRREGQEPVALFFERDASLIIANLAVLKAGKIALHVDPNAPGDRTAHILQDSGAPLILTNHRNSSMALHWAKHGMRLLNVDEPNQNFPDDNVQMSISPEAFANITYTSGSTAQAKGAVKTHRSILHVVRNFTNCCHICPYDRLMVFGRGVSGKHLFNGLLNGATQYLVDKNAEGLLHLADWLAQEEISIFASLPTVFRHLASSLPVRENFPKLRLIRLSGEPLLKSDVELYKNRFSSACLLVNTYAAQETGDVCLYFMDRSTAIIGSRAPVGYTLEGAEVSVLDDFGNKAEANQPGEIVVTNPFRSSGYWEQSEATRDKFSSVASGAKIFRTGDLGQMSMDGCLIHLGRKDSMIKIRSFRVDTADVEVALAHHPEVKAVAVIGRQTSSGDVKLVAYFVPNTEPAPAVTSLRSFLKDKLPDYMIPSAFIALEALPLTATGKLNRRALPEPGVSRPKLSQAYAPPQTPVEARLERIWAEVLTLDQVGIHDNFFDLGGHSLAATRVVSQVIKQFQLEIPLQLLFQSPTIGAMAAVISRHQANKLSDVKLDRILAELESLSEEEAGKILADHSSRAQDRGD